jgi:hypothetical protein
VTRRQTPAQAERRRERDRVNKALARARAKGLEIPDAPRGTAPRRVFLPVVPRPEKRLAGPGGMPGRAAGVVRRGDRR